ncbi:MAG TPA: DUF1326 domain-containing protein [Candidatus Nanopelagicales bacterium]|nr:DUF1326 domain-containing protein [Candidatus Nanopelagicales bacterium]
MTWDLTGTYFENCSCDMVCPCTTSGLTMPADQERCRVVLAFHVDRGQVDGLDVSGRSVVVVADTPQVMAEGNWRLGLVMDAQASSDQAAALGAVFGGQAGGPMAALVPLVSEMMGMESAPIEYVDDGHRHALKVEGLLDIEIEDYVAPQLRPDGDPEMLTGMFHPASSTLTVAQATRGRITVFGLDVDNGGKNGHSSPFAWSA